MSLLDGTAAFNLEFTDHVPRTEYSAEFHWPLINRVCGTRITEASPQAEKDAASVAFMRKWNYGFHWNALIYGSVFAARKTELGHAVFREGGVDYRNNSHEAFESPEDVYSLDMDETYGVPDHQTLVKNFNADLDHQGIYAPYMVTMTGIYVSCISGLIELLGWNVLLEALGEDPDEFGAFTQRYGQWISRYFKALADSKGSIVMVHDDMVWTEGPFVNPAWYRKYVFPVMERNLDYLHRAGKKVVFTCDGNFTALIDDMAPMVDGFVMEPSTDIQYIAEHYGNNHFFVGNADTRVLLYGTKDEIRREVQRCMDIGKDYPGFFLSVGNHIPPNTPVESCLWYQEFYEELGRR